MKTLNIYIKRTKLTSTAVQMLLVLFFGLFSLSSTAQLVPRDGKNAIQMPNLTFKGQYDIRMVSSVGLQPAWISSVNPFVVHSIITDEEIRKGGKSFTLNNSLAGSTANAVVNPPAGVIKPVGAIGATMVYADCDKDSSTFQSSAALLDFGSEMECTVIHAAYLYWVVYDKTDITNYASYPGLPTMNSYVVDASHPGNVGQLGGTAYKTVKFKAPGDITYKDVTASREFGSDGRKICFKDVTNLVKGKRGGQFWVANLRSTSMSQLACGWTLVVIFTPPNCPPRTIKFWDGYQDIGSGNKQTFRMKFDSGEVPASGNSKSYLGLGVLDGENFAAYLIDGGHQPEYLEFQTKRNVTPLVGPLMKINPFITDQPGYTLYDASGALLTNDARDGFSSSHITSWSEENKKNGNEIVRVPSLINTVGYDAHHIKLPPGSMVAGADSALMTYYAGPQGSTSPFLAYMAIETLQPNLKLYKSAVAETITAGGIINYSLKVENIGAVKSKPGAYITDTLDLPIDLVAGSIKYYDKLGIEITPPQAPVIGNQGSDVNENIKFFVPEIEAGVNEVATDSVIIKFQVQVKGLSSTIWNVGCRRVIKNKATIYYAADDGSTLVGGSNSMAGCGGGAEFSQVKVDDTVLETQYQQTHFIEDTLTTQVNAGIASGNPLKIDATVRTYLTQKLVALGQPASDAALYSVYDDEGVVVSPTTAFTQVEPIQNYSATLDLGYECVEIFNFKFVVAKVPKVVVTASKTICAGDASGKLKIKVSDGDPSYRIKVTNAADTTVVYYTSYTDPTQSTVTVTVPGLTAGAYSVFVKDKGIIPASVNVTVLDTIAFSTGLTAVDYVCDNSSATLTATPTLSGPLTYVWEKSVDGIVFNDIVGANSATLTETIDQNYTYKVYVCNGTCQAWATKYIEARPIPIIDFDLATTKNAVSIAIPGTVATLASTLTAGSYTAPATYVWQVSTNGGTTWNAVNGSTSPGTYTNYTTSTLTIANLNLSMNGNLYKVIITDASGCTDENIIDLVVSEGPVAIIAPAAVSCFGLSDASVSFNVSEGELGQTYDVYIYKGTFSSANAPIVGNQFYTSTYNKTTAPVPYALPTNVAAGPYTIQFVPASPNPLSLPISYVNFTVTTPAAINVNTSGVSQVCTGSNVTLTSTVSGGPSAGTKAYQWLSSTDDIIYNPIGGKISSSMSSTMLMDTYFKLEASVGVCKDTSAAHRVLSLPTPVIVADLAVDSGCYRYDLTTLPVRETTGISNYTLTLHNKMPLNVFDVSSLIPTTKYLIKNNQYVYAKMTVGGLCYDVVPVKIHIKPMDECHPVIVPEFFSPDGDGLNDLFIIQDLDDYWGPKIYVYDRFGKVVFEGGKEEMMKGWDGTYLNQPLPTADYWYKMVFEEIEPKVGYFALKRRRE